MKRAVLPSLAFLIASLGAIAIAGDLNSGLQVGDSAGAFNVKDVTGPAKGTSLCYR